MIRKSRNFFLGILSFIPVLVLVASIILFGKWVSMGISEFNFHVNELIPILILQSVNLVLTGVTVVLMSLHAAKSPKIDRQQLVIWILLLAFFSIITLPVYWAIYVRDDKEDKVIKQCAIDKDNIKEEVKLASKQSEILETSNLKSDNSNDINVDVKEKSKKDKNKNISI